MLIIIINQITRSFIKTYLQVEQVYDTIKPYYYQNTHFWSICQFVPIYNWKNLNAIFLKFKWIQMFLYFVKFLSFPKLTTITALND